jgi:hypothetical protein
LFQGSFTRPKKVEDKFQTPEKSLKIGRVRLRFVAAAAIAQC